MVLIKKQPKLSRHMTSMPINDRRLIKPVMLICFCSAKLGVNIVSFSNGHNIVSSLICGGQNKPPMEFLYPFLQVSKSEFRCTLLYVHSSIAIILMGKRELIALLNLSSWCLVMVERLFLAVPRVSLQFVIVVFLDHTHLLFFRW